MSTLFNLFTKQAPNDISNRKRLVRDTLVEFLATTIFVYFGTLSAVSTGRKLAGQGSIEDVGRILPIAFSFGVSITVLAYSMGHISGGHMNPGVSFLMLLKGQMSPIKMLCYWAAQFVGALLGSALLWGSVSDLQGHQKGEDEVFSKTPFDLGSTTLDPNLSPANGFLLELMGSFFFYFVISQTALDKRGIAESFFPAIPIGFSLIVVHVCLIPFTGCGVNPARTFGPSMVVCMSGGDCSGVMGSWYWIYYTAPFLAAYCVAEITTLMEWNVDEDIDEAQTINEAAKTPEFKTLDIINETVDNKTTIDVA